MRMAICCVVKYYNSGIETHNRRISTEFLYVYIYLFLRSGADVMITIFCDFCPFSAKNWRFSQKQCYDQFFC
jgi:hypothetical protein